ncbi:MAG: TonB-dependent receptor [Cytophagales bacterium]|nr:TonB-dependent receptor [Cytophagales bacterium]
MLKYILFIFFYILFSFYSFAQKGVIKGVVKDKTTGETLIGATVLIGEGVGTVTDLDGKFFIKADYGEYTLDVSYVGYQAISRKIILDKKLLYVKDFKLQTIILSEVEVVADFAIERETPVAFSNISIAKIQEELASQDIPMILNSTPGVYATQQGGGDGDARITIRGFNQRNVAVMIDGIPVNDMENGWVYWSNWFGLDAVTRVIQVQRGLGASKIAIPSVGGTLNILTKGIDNKRNFSVKQEVGSFGLSRTSFAFNSGRLNNGWGYTFAGSYKKRDGWAEHTFSKAWFYFGKLEKMVGNHLISLTAMGAPQKHGQRSFKHPITVFDKKFASKVIQDVSIDTLSYDNPGKDFGVTYNQNWGYLERYTIAPNGDTIPAKMEVVNEKLNYYHKPQFSLKDFWSINDKLYLSNILYMSVGRGGGTGNKDIPRESTNGRWNYQAAYDENVYGPANVTPSGERRSTGILRSSINNHTWYGFLSTLNYKLNDVITLSGGTDFRYYKGEHYRVVYDLLGGDVYRDPTNLNQKTVYKRKDDIIDYHNDGLVKWGGLFAQAEYKAGLISAFINISGAYTGYKRVDYFKRKDLVIVGQVFEQIVGNEEMFFYNGTNYIQAFRGANFYTSYDTTFVVNNFSGKLDTSYILNAQGYTNHSPEARYAQTDWKWIPGVTVKGGVNYNLNENMNVFLNLGYISKAQRFNNVIDYNNKFFRNIENELIKAIEIGYSYKHSNYAANINGYITKWKNKPVDRGITVIIDDEAFTANVNGIDALHKGIEFDFIYNLSKNLDLEGLLSVGDWKWDSGDTVRVFDDQGQVIYKDYFNAKGIHVGDAAQIQYAATLRYEPVAGLYIKGRFTYFGNHYADFNPLSLDGSSNATDENGNPKESWKIPYYSLVDFHAGYRFQFNKVSMNLRFSVLNALNNVYISDAQNNDSYTQSYDDFDAKSAAVFFGLPRRYNLSLKITI